MGKEEHRHKGYLNDNGYNGNIMSLFDNILKMLTDNQLRSVQRPRDIDDIPHASLPPDRTAFPPQKRQSLKEALPVSSQRFAQK
jgi:hypothetical protein